MQPRLTKETATLERLNELAVSEAGLLGPYSRAEYDQLSELDVGSWEFVFVESKLDENFGQLKIRPKSTQSTKLINRGRALKLKEREAAADYDVDTLINFINAVKREPMGNVRKVQDFLLTHWKDYEERFGRQPVTNDEFGQWAIPFKEWRLKRDHEDAIQHLMPRVISSMRKPPTKKKAGNKNHLRRKK